MLLLEIMQAGMFGRSPKAIKPFQGKREKLALFSKPHILLSHMVLLTEHLSLALDWIEFQENLCFKKKWLIWGKLTSAASFQALWFVALVGYCTWNFFFSTCLPTSSRQREGYFGLVITGKRAGSTQTSKARPTSELTSYSGPPQQDHSPVLADRHNLRVQSTTPTFCFLCMGGNI